MPARSPRARAPRAGRAAPLAPGGGRRSARGSSWDELEAVRDVADFPALRLDLATQAVCRLEVLASARRLTLLGQPDQTGRRRPRVREPPEADQPTPPAQRGGAARRAPLVEESKCLGRVEVVVEHAG